jgi:hypothetical protein
MFSARRQSGKCDLILSIVLSEWSYQRTFHHDTPDKVLCRLWWPRFVAELTNTSHTATMIDVVHWIDDPGDRREAIIDAAHEAFMLKRGDP